jgi:hypothetical protein
MDLIDLDRVPLKGALGAASITGQDQEVATDVVRLIDLLVIVARADGPQPMLTERSAARAVGVLIIGDPACVAFGYGYRRLVDPHRIPAVLALIVATLIRSLIVAPVKPVADHFLADVAIRRAYLIACSGLCELIEDASARRARSDCKAARTAAVGPDRFQSVVVAGAPIVGRSALSIELAFAAEDNRSLRRGSPQLPTNIAARLAAVACVAFRHAQRIITSNYALPFDRHVSLDDDDLTYRKQQVQFKSGIGVGLRCVAPLIPLDEDNVAVAEWVQIGDEEGRTRCVAAFLLTGTEPTKALFGRSADA